MNIQALDYAVQNCRWQDGSFTNDMSVRKFETPYEVITINEPLYDWCRNLYDKGYRFVKPDGDIKHGITYPLCDDIRMWLAHPAINIKALDWMLEQGWEQQGKALPNDTLRYETPHGVLKISIRDAQEVVELKLAGYHLTADDNYIEDEVTTKAGIKMYKPLEDFKLDPQPATENKYHRKLTATIGDQVTVTIDVYDVLKAFNVTDPALQHLIKKALCCGLRGHKDRAQDLQDILDSAQRAKELHDADAHRED